MNEPIHDDISAAIHLDFYPARRTDWKLAISVAVTIATLTAFVVMLLLVGCRSVSPANAPQATRIALAKVGAAYSALSVLYETAVDVRIEVCKLELGPDATKEQHVACLGPLASEGKITLSMLRAGALYDDAAIVLEDLAGELAALGEALASTKGGAP